MPDGISSGPEPLTEIEIYFEAIRNEELMEFLRRMDKKTPRREFTEEEALLILSKIQCSHELKRCDCTVDNEGYLALLLGHILPTKALYLMARKSHRMPVVTSSLILRQDNITPRVLYHTLWGVQNAGEAQGLLQRELVSRELLQFVTYMEELYGSHNWEELDTLGETVLGLEPDRWEVFKTLMTDQEKTSWEIFSLADLERMLACAQLA